MSDENGKLLGDVTADMLRKMRADRIARAYTKITKKPCNCKQNKEMLNEVHRKWRDAQVKRGRQIKTNTPPNKMIGIPKAGQNDSE